MPPKHYYYIDGRGKKQGPFTFALLKEKRIRPSTLIWSDGMETWLPAGEISHLKALFRKPPPPVPKDKQATPQQEKQAEKGKEKEEDDDDDAPTVLPVGTGTLPPPIASTVEKVADSGCMLVGIITIAGAAGLALIPLIIF